MLSIKKEDEEGIIWWNTDTVGFVDRSWKEEKQQDGSILIKAGISGYLIDRRKMVKFMFSGPTKAWCPLESERMQ